jgi:hypothetical protein
MPRSALLIISAIARPTSYSATTVRGDTWYAAMSNGGFNSWQHIGGSDPTYGVKT